MTISKYMSGFYFHYLSVDYLDITSKSRAFYLYFNIIKFKKLLTCHIFPLDFDILKVYQQIRLHKWGNQKVQILKICPILLEYDWPVTIAAKSDKRTLMNPCSGDFDTWLSKLLVCVEESIPSVVRSRVSHNSTGFARSQLLLQAERRSKLQPKTGPVRYCVPDWQIQWWQASHGG